MIALQVLSVTDVNDTIQWDGIDRGYESWNKDQTMKSALPISCVWFYQELARRTGQKEMQKWLTKSNYGNKKIGSKIDKFWLDGTLAISANEQIVFLEKLINNKLPFDKNIQESVKNNDYRLYRTLYHSLKNRLGKQYRLEYRLYRNKK